MPTPPPTLTDAPASPDRSDRATFTARSIALDDYTKNAQIPEARIMLANVYANSVEAYDAAVLAVPASEQAVASAASALAAPGTSATSTTSLTIGTGTHNLTIQTGKSISIGQRFIVAYTSGVTNYMIGGVVSYNSATGALVLTVSSGDTNGSGTYTAWTVSVTSKTASILNAVDVSTLGPSIRPSLLLDFANSKTVDGRITTTRASTATYFDALGVMRTAAINEPVIDHDPVTGECLGLRSEAAAANSIRNNTMVGAAAGTPGTAPTNWTYRLATTGLSVQTVGEGLVNNMDYLDLRLFGTATASDSFQLFFDSATGIPALQNQVFALSAFLQVVAGTTNGLSFGIYVDEYSSASSYLSSGGSIIQPNSSSLARYTTTRTISNASAAYARPLMNFTVVSGAAIDITMRIGMPQLERDNVSSIIPTTTAAVTRAADVHVMTGTNFSDWYNAVEGAIVCEYATGSDLNGTRAMSINNAGSSEVIEIISASGSSLGGYGYLVDGAVVQAALPTGTTVVANTTSKVAFAYKANDFAGSRDGGAVATDTSGTLPTVDRMHIGCDGGGGSQLAGHIKRIAYFPRRLVNAELVALSTQ